MTPVPPTDNVLSFLLWMMGFMVIGTSGALVWIAKYVILPMRDRHFRFLDSLEESSAMQTNAMHTIVNHNEERMAMHRDNLKLLTNNQSTLSNIATILSRLACAKEVP